MHTCNMEKHIQSHVYMKYAFFEEQCFDSDETAQI